ncbi:MAG: hypothetical protein HYV97_14275 [Bdellovibrio sp.]|nr:hypothetical protein [Bdellovibrio sp.]
MVIYFSILKNSPHIDLDYKSNIIPLLTVDSIEKYFSSAQIFDLQPIRDLSLLLDIYQERITGYSSFHLQNFILWLAIVSFAYFLLLKIGVQHKHAYSIVFLISTHPVGANVVSDIASRKHLLSVLFILLTTIFYLSWCQLPKKTTVILIILMYLLSILSQPITVLWPMLPLVQSFFQIKMRLKLRQLLVLLLPIASLCFYFNYRYYTGKYLHQANAIKIYPMLENLQLIPQMYGRYFINIIFPFDLALYYKIYSVQNLAGSILFMLWLWLLKKRLSILALVLPLVLYFIPLIVVTFNITPIFVSDMYLILPLIVFFYLSYKSVINLIHSQTLLAIMVIVLCVFSLLSYRQSRIWLSNKSIWENDYKNQPSHESALQYVKFLLNEGDSDFDAQLTRKIIFDFAKFETVNPLKDLFPVSQKYVLKVFCSKKYSSIQKIKYLNDFPFESIQKSDYLKRLSSGHSETSTNPCSFLISQ